MSPMAKSSRVQEILLQREAGGLRITTIARILLSLMLITTHVFLAQSRFELFAASALNVVHLFTGALFLYWIHQRRNLAFVGVGGAVTDVLTMAIMPVLWYDSLGGYDAIQPSFLFKGSSFFLILGYILINSLALRPVYPAIAAAGGSVIMLVILAIVLLDPRTEFTGDLRRVFLGSGFSVGFYVMGPILGVPLIGVATVYLTRVARRTIIQAAQLEKANAQLGRYFSPNVAASIARARDDFMKPGGRLQNAAVMFSDIRDFTSLSEKLSPDQVLKMLSEYHEVMVAAIFKHGGTLDKFIGDGIMAVFGTPEAGPHDARNAVLAGIEMKKALAELNREREARGSPAIKQGIGIHYGQVVAGNIGTEMRLEYTVIGDTVNLASRLESSCKKLGEDFLISEAVRAELGEAEIATREIGRIRVKGKEEPATVHAVSV